MSYLLKSSSSLMFHSLALIFAPRVGKPSQFIPASRRLSCIGLSYRGTVRTRFLLRRCPALPRRRRHAPLALPMETATGSWGTGSLLPHERPNLATCRQVSRKDSSSRTVIFRRSGPPKTENFPYGNILVILTLGDTKYYRTVIFC